MKLLVLLIALAVGAMVYPRYAEHTDDVCAAFTKRLEALASAQHLRSSPRDLSDLAKATMEAQYPQVPEMIRCTVAYWATMVNPDVAEAAKRLLTPAAPPK